MRKGSQKWEGTLGEEPTKEKPKALVICTEHEVQRHQDTMKEREARRAEFEKIIRREVEKRKISLIAEEAGDDEEVWKRLKQGEGKTPAEFAKLFEDAETVDKPVGTIAKKIADEQPKLIRHIDIRPPNADGIKTIQEYDKEMARRIIDAIKDTDTGVLVIVGHDHCNGVTELLTKQGF